MRTSKWRLLIWSVPLLQVMVMLTLVLVSAWQNSWQGDIPSAKLNGPLYDLLPALSRSAADQQDIAVEVSGGGLILTGRGSASLEANQINGLIFSGRNLAFVAEVNLRENGYRGFATLVIREDDDRLYSDRVWSVSNNVAWKTSSPTQLILPIPPDLAVEQATVELLLYERGGDIALVLEVSKLAIYEIAEMPDPGAKLIATLSKHTIIFMALIIVGMACGITWWSANNPLRPIFPLSIVLGGACVIASVALVDSLPINSLRLRADAWSYDIVARSLASSFGFKSYDVYEPTTYPIVPLYYGLAYKLADIGVITVIWANIFLSICSWTLVVFLDGRFSLIRAIASLLIITLWIVPWVNVPWTLSGTLGAFTITLLASIAILAWRRRDMENNWRIVLGFGLATSIAALTRTEYYALIPLCLLHIFLCSNRSGKTKSFLTFSGACMFALLPWLVFQVSVSDPVPEKRSVWDTDASRVISFSASAVDAIFNEAALDRGIQKVAHNLVTLVGRPYTLYVYDVPASRPELAAKHYHQFILLLFLVASIAFVLNRKSDSAAYGAMICILIFYRCGYLSMISDSPRYFSTFVYLIAAYISEALKTVIVNDQVSIASEPKD